MNAQFTKDQIGAIRTLLSMFHPDKCAAEHKDAADGFTKAVNQAKDKGTYSVIAQIMALVAKYGITKDTKDRMAEAWAEFNAQPQTEGTRSGAGTKERKAKAEDTRSGAGPKAKAEPTIDPVVMAKAKAKQDETGWERSKMGSWLNLEFDLRGAAAKVYLDEIFKSESSGTGRSGWADQLYSKLKQGPVTKAELEVWAKSTGSNNVWNHLSHYWAICEMANAIWAKK